MKKINDYFILVFFILIFIISYIFDNNVNSFFKHVKLPVIDAVLSIITNFGVVVLVMVLIPAVILFKNNRKAAYLIFFTFAVSFILAFVIKLIVLRQRPIEAFTYPFTGIINYSFPSMHAMVAFSLLPVMVKHLQKQKIFFIMFAFLVAFSRIYFGVHFLSDVVFGAFAGYFIGKYLLELHEKKKLWVK